MIQSDYKMEKENMSPTIRWRKGELIGEGTYGRVYRCINLDTGGLLAVKQVEIAASNGSNEKAQEHIKALELEIKILRNLSHRNIVQYLGTTREKHALNILLEFVPGGSISSLLDKFGSFSEPGGNILVSNTGCIKLADFGASKKLLELEAVTGAKSVKGTPYWMAPEVIRQDGHGLSADIWSVGCTVIEMATGKPPWSQQFEKVAAFYNIGKSKSQPLIPDHLSSEAKDFLLKCLNREPNSRPSASELLQHRFVVGDQRELLPLVRPSARGECDSNYEKDDELEYNSKSSSDSNISDLSTTSELLNHPVDVGGHRELHSLVSRSASKFLGILLLGLLFALLVLLSDYMIMILLVIMENIMLFLGHLLYASMMVIIEKIMLVLGHLVYAISMIVFGVACKHYITDDMI